MDEEKVDNAPIRFFAVSHGTHDCYEEHYVLATSPEDALRRFMKSEQPYCNVVGTVWEADLDENGIIHKTKELYEMELPGREGYLWKKTGLKEVDEIDEKYHIIRCLLCGGGPNDGEDDATFLNENSKCVDCAKYKIWNNKDVLPGGTGGGL
jgi:hypothetical protein